MPDHDGSREVLVNSALFQGLPAAVISAIAAAMHPVEFTAGQLIFSRGDPGDAIYVVLSGRVRLSILTPDGAELSFAHAVKGDVFGEIAVLDASTRSADATALEAVTASRLSAAQLERLLMDHRSLSRSIIRFLCRRVREVSDHFEDVALMPLETRIARYLLGRAAGGNEGRTASDRNQRTISLGMSQSELALLIGASRQKVNAALMALEKSGAIIRNGVAYECRIPILNRIAKIEDSST